MGVLCILLGFGSLSFFGEHGILSLIRLGRLHHSLQENNASLIQHQESLRQEARRLKNLRYVEFLARKNLGLMRSNEIFVVMDHANTMYIDN